MPDLHRLPFYALAGTQDLLHQVVQVRIAECQWTSDGRGVRLVLLAEIHGVIYHRRFFLTRIAPETVRRGGKRL